MDYFKIVSQKIKLKRERQICWAVRLIRPFSFPVFDGLWDLISLTAHQILEKKKVYWSVDILKFKGTLISITDSLLYLREVKRVGLFTVEEARKCYLVSGISEKSQRRLHSCKVNFCLLICSRQHDMQGRNKPFCLLCYTSLFIWILNNHYEYFCHLDIYFNEIQFCLRGWIASFNLFLQAHYELELWNSSDGDFYSRFFLQYYLPEITSPNHKHVVCFGWKHLCVLLCTLCILLNKKLL